MKIVLGEYLNSFLRLLSNFTYLGFSLCRLFKIGKDHGKLIEFMNKLSIKKYMIVCVVVSGGLSVCKALQYNINIAEINFAFPLHFSQNEEHNSWHNSPHFVAITSVNAIYDLINYFCFVIIQLVVDLVLIKKLWQVIGEKEVKLAQMMRTASNKQKISKENEESKRRAIFMVVFSSVFNFATKIPSLVTSLNDVRLLILNPFVKNAVFSELFFGYNPFVSNLTFRFFCMKEKSCLVFQNFGNCLFLVSLCSVVYFLKNFDNNFKAAYRELFKNRK